VTGTETTTTSTGGRVRVEQCAKRIRAYLGGELVADTTRPRLVSEKPYYPAYYVPADDARTDLLSPDGEISHSPSRGRLVCFYPDKVDLYVDGIKQA
jgi:uncharacterized protein (DUF427 family)